MLYTVMQTEKTSPDVVGIIKDYDQIRDLKNKHGQDQKKNKVCYHWWQVIVKEISPFPFQHPKTYSMNFFCCSSNVNVTFWDKFGESFDKSMKNPLDKPVIIILSGCKVGKWNGNFFAPKIFICNIHICETNSKCLHQGEVDLSNSYATKVYLNYKHHSVVHLRKLLVKS